ncbi:crotonase/enoyl-CoA hydratase family protein [Pseudomaricurvus alkylphenolicus]|uniref:crotonase/enoyl-CoA hydratase family protein n=1 Tax=Pseudomaricurvus alkylphenolicus TaxID=1306991 RepID=UPI0014206D50|nr:crotonase/enoyl-CoA hydratase family protein [Pseudomaricurvus alkylphenolicus]NIB44094.1 crotonase/enoyl-CoA hydratase family protein [Pseudomaricurvus alkylphenolicus]
MNQFLQTEREGAVLVVRMNAPETRNALSDPGQMQEFVDLCQAVNLDNSVKALVLTGNGSAFCAGGNIKDMHTRGGIFGGAPHELRNNYRNGIQRIPLSLYNLEVPVIAAINGPAIGAGLDLTCMCDVRIASSKAKFAESFIKLGIVPGDGGAWLLPRIIGLPKASIMALTGDTIDPAQALSWDLVTDVVEPEELLPKAMEMAQRMAANPAHGLRLTKKLLREGQHMRLDSLLELSAAFQSLAHNAEDHLEAVSAFIEKRSPDFKDC